MTGKKKTKTGRGKSVPAKAVRPKRKTFTVYVLRSAEGRMYIGFSQDVEKRIRQHNAKSNRGWTRRFTGWKTIYTEEFRTRKQAMRREKELKRIRSSKKYKKMVGI
jgi:putative endonuclease